ncbi:MAG TPA: hypothetical protein HA224_02590 [Nanoarchaeota archaeon]|nr:hypothetical protein [Nanoarchaeota archaeon]
MSKSDLEHRVGIAADFDDTISTKMQWVPLLTDNFKAIKKRYDGTVVNVLQKDGTLKKVQIRINEPLDWFKLCNAWGVAYNGVGYLQQFLWDVRDGVFPNITRDYLRGVGARVKLAPGLPGFFSGMRKEWNGRVDVSAHIISVGSKEIIEGSPVAREVDSIYASELASSGQIFGRRNHDLDGLREVVSPFSKSRQLISLAKGEGRSVDDLLSHQDYKIAHQNIIYIGDGMSDIPISAYASKKGALIICVYPPGDVAAYAKAMNNKRITDRVHWLVPRDYTVDSPLWNIVNARIERIASGERCAEFDPLSLDSYEKGKLRPAWARDIEAHLPKCIDCSDGLRFQSVFRSNTTVRRVT